MASHHNTVTDNNEKLLIIGAGGHARSVIDTVQCEGRYEILGLLADNLDMGAEVYGYRVLGGLDTIAAIANGNHCHQAIIAVGDNFQRERIATRLRGLDPGVHFSTTIHPAAVISPSAKLGEGVVIMAGVVINAGAVIGEGCLLNTRASIDHDCVLGEFASIAPGATLGGNVRVGARTAIGLGAGVIHKITIGADTVIGAGAVVVCDQPEGVVAYGNPCRTVRQRDCHSSYL